MSGGENVGWEAHLSLVGNEQTGTVRPRQGVTLLRPVIMNAVEVGYSYTHCDRNKKLNVRGVTIALWYFICRGHQAIALLPYCFKNYAEKSSRHSELMALHRLNLIEFTPGYGSEKYAEVNRIMVNRAYETGGCIVARSQMQGITDNKTNLINVVEQRLLMPTFNGDDIMFPIDGPLGRNGPTLKQTLECEQSSSDWRACSEHQLLFSDQKHWLEKLAALVPEKTAWTMMNQMIASVSDCHHPPPPPTSTPSGGGGPFNFDAMFPNDQFTFPPMPVLEPTMPLNRSQFAESSAAAASAATVTTTMKQLRKPRKSALAAVPATATTQGTGNRGKRRSSKHSATTDSVESTTNTSTRSCASGRHVADCNCIEMNGSPTSVDDDLAIDEEEIADELMVQLKLEEEMRKKIVEQRKCDEILARLSQIFGYSKSSRVISKYQHIRSFPQLVEKCIQEEDQDGDDVEFSDIRQPAPADLIDFSTDVLQPIPISAAAAVAAPRRPTTSQNHVDLLL